MGKSVRIAVVGDRFMHPGSFTQALRSALPDWDLTIGELQLPFPDEPVGHGRPGDDLAGLREFQGDPAAILSLAEGAEILVNHVGPLSASMLERLPSLQLIAMARGGAVNVDIAAARHRGIKIVNTPGRNASAVAEFTIGAILAETRNLRRGHESLRAGLWRGDLYRAELVGPELSELTVGVIGYGAIGRRVVRLLRAFDARVIVCDPYVTLSDDDRQDGVVQRDLSQLLAESDIVTLHARLTEETNRLIDAPRLAQIKPGAFLINTARGAMIDPDAVLAALGDGRLSGAMLETFPIEPVPADHPLLRHERITLTPHIAGASRQTIRRTSAMVAEEVRRHLSGLAPVNPL